MENIQRTRETIYPNEWNILENLSKNLQELLLEIFSLEELNTETSPFRYKFTHKNNEYEFIISSMGSFTIRPIMNTTKRKNSPIFYLSVSKYAGKFLWEDEKQEIVQLEKENLKKLILLSIERYETTLS